MGRLASNVRQIAPKPDYPQIQMMPVIGIGDDDKTVILDAGNGKPVIAPCLRGYGGRAEGDQVCVLKLSPKNWLVLGAPGEPIGDYLTVAAVQAMIDKSLAAQPTAAVLFGDGAPTGDGWTQAAVLPWVRDDGNGNTTTWFQLGTPAPPPSSPPTGTPDPITVTPNSHGSYRPGGQSDSGIIQGAWTGSNWTGALFYGSKIADACNGKTVASMEITLARLDDTSGWNRGVNVHLGVHGHQSKTTTIALDRVHTLGTLAHGQRRTFTLPDEVVNGLKDGTYWGVGVGQTSDYVKFTDSSGSIKITFS